MPVPGFFSNNPRGFPFGDHTRPQDLLANGNMRLMVYAGNTGRPDFPYEMWVPPPRNPDEDGTHWKDYQVRHVRTLDGLEWESLLCSLSIAGS
jgi:hypothetical protein